MELAVLLRKLIHAADKRLKRLGRRGVGPLAHSGSRLLEAGGHGGQRAFRIGTGSQAFHQGKRPLECRAHLGIGAVHGLERRPGLGQLMSCGPFGIGEVGRGQKRRYLLLREIGRRTGRRRIHGPQRRLQPIAHLPRSGRQLLEAAGKRLQLIGQLPW